MRPSRALSVSLAALISLLALTACQTATTPVEEEPQTPHGYVEGAEEAEEPQLRLSVVDGADGGLRILDLLSEETLHEAPGSESTVLAAADDRYLYLGDAGAGTVRIVDTGAWTVDHGDHKHFYRAGPAEVGEAAGVDPAHVLVNDSAAALFFDGDGSAQVYDRTAFADGELISIATVQPGPHHGVAVPFADTIVSTVPGSDADELPAELVAYAPDGTATPIEARCEELHGAAVVRSGLVFACADGVLRIDEELGTELLPYPEGAQGERAWSLIGGRDLIAAPVGEHGVALLDPEQGEWRAAELDATPISVGVAPDDGYVVVLDEEGNVHSVDPESGDVLASKPLLDELESPEGRHGPGASVAADRERAYISDPIAGTVLELDVADDLREARTFEVGGQPAGIAVTGR